jgi:hypothetical protein
MAFTGPCMQYWYPRREGGIDEVKREYREIASAETCGSV